MWEEASGILVIYFTHRPCRQARFDRAKFGLAGFDVCAE